MSAGEFSPSSRMVAAISDVLPYLMLTSMPLASANCSMSGATRLSLRPE